MLEGIDRLVDLVGVRTRALTGATVADVATAIAAGDLARLAQTSGHFAGVGRQGRTVRLARTIGGLPPPCANSPRPAGLVPISPHASPMRSHRSTSLAWQDPAKRNWYGVDVEDTVRAAHRLDASPEAIRALYAGLRTKSKAAVTYGG